MEKKILDYLPLYLGCQVQWNYDLKSRFWILGIDDDRCRLKTQSGASIFPIEIEDVTLALRLLSDIKIEEAAYCLKETYFDHVEYPITDFRLEFVGQDKNNPRVKIDNDWFTNELTFGCNSGSIWNSQEKESPGNTKLKASIYIYLIKQGFDLFGLIPAGLAIDRNTLPIKTDVK